MLVGDLNVETVGLCPDGCEEMKCQRKRDMS